MHLVSEVQSKKQWREFINLPWLLYRNTPEWVPPLKAQVRDLLDIHKNPFFGHARSLPLLIHRDGKPIGRIVGIIDEKYNVFHGKKAAFFGFFECVEDAEAIAALFQTVADWAAGAGMTELCGP